MSETKYELYVFDELVASNLKIDTLMILLHGLIDTWYEEYEIKFDIKKMAVNPT